MQMHIQFYLSLIWILLSQIIANAKGLCIYVCMRVHMCVYAKRLLPFSFIFKTQMTLTGR